MSGAGPFTREEPRAHGPGPVGVTLVANDPLRAAHAEANRCIQCGFCLPACPTFKAFGVEKHSPRGRIHLVKSWAEGNAAPDAEMLAALDLCLDCRACEVACPIDVRYGVVITGARDELADRRASGDIGGVWARIRASALKVAMRHIVAKPRRIGFVAGIAYRVVHGRLGRRLDAAARRRADSWFGAAFTFARAIPRPSTAPISGAAPSGGPSTSNGASTAKAASTAGMKTGTSACSAPASQAPGPAPKAALFLGCAQEGLFPETNRATAALLRRAGFVVEIPEGQVCCGALHRHNGDKEYARSLVLQNLRRFGAFDEEPGYDVIATNAGGCLAWIKEAAELFPPNSAEHQAARRLAERARDISEILVEAGAASEDANIFGPATAGDVDETVGPRVIYQPSCHLTNVCGVSRPPLDLLRRLHGDNVTLPPDGGSCCGSAGIFNALQPHASRDILERKMDSVDQAHPDVIVTSNPGCHLQMLAGVRARGLEGRVRVVQLAEWLYEHAAPTPAPGQNADVGGGSD